MPSPNTQRRFVSAAAAYFGTQILLTMAGFVSMPVTTRLLSKAEYGTLNLVLASVGIMVVIGQMGFPQATTRFFAERHRQGKAHLREFCDNMLGGAFTAGLLVALVAAGAAAWIAGGAGPYYASCVRLGSLVVLVRVVSSVIYQLFRADERVFTYMVAQIVSRYCTLALVIAMLFLRGQTAYQIILATVIGEGVVLVACLAELAARGVIRRPRLSPSVIKAATLYGAPLAAAGSASFILDYGDRYLIQHFLGLDAVATYAVPYDLAQSLAAALFGPVRLAVIPIIFRLWAEGGQEMTSPFVSRLMTYVVSIAIPIGVLFLLMNREVIELLASQKYSDSARLTPYLLPGVLLGELNFLVASALTIQKETVTLALYVFGVGILNVVLNLILLPRWGLTGAAVATSVAYVTLFVITFLRSRPVLRLRIDVAVLARSLLATALMVAFVVALGPVSSKQLLDVIVRCAAGGAVAAGCMLLLDRDLRRGTWLRTS